VPRNGLLVGGGPVTNNVRGEFSAVDFPSYKFSVAPESGEMMSRHILAGFLLASFCGSANAQIGESPLDTLNRLKAQEQAGQEPVPTPLDDFDILDLPEDLFQRRTPSRPRRKLPPLVLDRIGTIDLIPSISRLSIRTCDGT